ncbi:ATP-binding protein [Bacteroides sp.]|uniref:sensor histidine kinase n=1 Tax=Bacteroides sp. TaxID=29523 RepID=UPI00261AC0A0|nr:ATP-binding protein [Bacteroides sp.]MDD3039379.1 ATP-binding protein [Bacteroides sp.]
MRQQLLQDSKELSDTYHITDAILRNVHAFILLIDNDFKVQKTNYYQQTGALESLDQKRVGDLLQCRNALSAEGGCGTHIYCGSCPIRHAIQEAFDQKKSFTNLEATLNIATSETKSVECDAIISGSYLLLDKEEKMVLTVHDVTKQKQTERALAQAKEKAEEADISKSVFLANMSHEIRTPLNAIMGFSEILGVANSTEEKVQYQQIIKMNAELLLQLINDILDMSKIEAGTLEFVRAEVDVNLLISELQQLFQMRAAETGGNIKILAEAPLPSCLIQTDRNRISQVLANFMTNAIKFTKKGSIRIGYEARENVLYFYVIDTGMGIAKDKLPEVFERFVKLNKDKKGTGLGLSIAKTIITKLDGLIGVDSEEGKGSTFWFTIPYSSCGKPQ